MRAPHCAVLSDLILNAASKRLEIMRHIAIATVSRVVDRQMRWPQKDAHSTMHYGSGVGRWR